MKLNYKQTILIGFAFMSILCFWQFYDLAIPYILQYKFGLKTVPANIIMATDNALAIFMLPLFGAISDKTKTRMGKRTPYILFGTIAAVILLNCVSFFNERVYFPGFFVCLVILLIVMAIYRSPAVAYMPDVTPKPLRSKANAIINLIGYVGGIFATVVMQIFIKSKGYDEQGNKIYQSDQPFSLVFLIISAFMLISVVVMVLFIKENKLVQIVDQEEQETKNDENLSSEEKRSLILILLSVFFWFAAYNAVTTMLSRYSQERWNAGLGESAGYTTVATIAAIVSFVPLGFLSSKAGRKATVIIGIMTMIVSFGAAFFISAGTPAIMKNVIFAVVGIGWATINVHSFPMVVELCRGRNIGKYTGYYYTFSMAAQIVTPILSGFFIDYTQWKERILFPYAVVFMVLALITMSFVKHGNAKPLAKDVILDALSGD